MNIQKLVKFLLLFVLRQRLEIYWKSFCNFYVEMNFVCANFVHSLGNNLNENLSFELTLSNFQI